MYLFKRKMHPRISSSIGCPLPHQGDVACGGAHLSVQQDTHVIRSWELRAGVSLGKKTAK